MTNNTLSKIKHIIFVILCIVIQTSIMPKIETKNVYPDIILMISVFYVLFYPLKFGLTYAFISSFILDSLTGYPIGIGTVSRFLAASFIGVIRDKVYLKIIIVILIVIAATFIKEIIFLMFYMILGNAVNIKGFIFNTFYKMLYNAIAAPIVFFIFKKMRSVFEEK